jgi:acyl-CoA hydrolase
MLMTIDTGTKLFEHNHNYAGHTFTVFPDDLNYAGTLFGGKVLAEMDIAAIKAVRRLLYKTDCDEAVTASIDRVDFKRPAHLGDIIDMRAEIIRLGKSSIDVKVIVTKEDQKGNVSLICEAKFTFVSLRNKKPYPHNCVFVENEKNNQS